MVGTCWVSQYQNTTYLLTIVADEGNKRSYSRTYLRVPGGGGVRAARALHRGTAHRPSGESAGLIPPRGDSNDSGDGSDGDTLDDALEAMLDAQAEAGDSNLFDDFEELAGQGLV